MTCALPGEPILIRSSRAGFWLRRSMIEGQFLDRRKLSPPRKVNGSTNDLDRGGSRRPRYSRLSARPRTSREPFEPDGQRLPQLSPGVSSGPGTEARCRRAPEAQLLPLQWRRPFVPEFDLVTIRIFYKCEGQPGAELAAPQKPTPGPLDGLERERQISRIREPETEVAQASLAPRKPFGFLERDDVEGARAQDLRGLRVAQMDLHTEHIAIKSKRTFEVSDGKTDVGEPAGSDHR